MDPNKISRLRQEQQMALTATAEKIKQFEKYRSDYEALQERLATLPDKLTHDVMVPFGKLAFMPGQLVHTNEILVLLGDNWFVERSSKQACDIASRRIKELDKRIEELKDQQKLLEPRLGLTSEMQAVAQGQGDYKEIVEEYDEEKERLWDEQHRVNVSKYRQELRKLKSSPKQNESRDVIEQPLSQQTTAKEEELWSRLNALELQEDERGELNSSFESDNSTGGRSKLDDECDEEEPPVTRDKRISWQASREDASENSSETCDDERDTSDDNACPPVVKTITFSHSNVPALSLNTNQEPTGDAGINISSPGEIYKLFSPKPILKKSVDASSSNADPTTVSGAPESRQVDYQPEKDRRVKIKTEGSVNTSTPHSVSSASRDKAFTGIVMENPAHASSGPMENVPPSTKPDQPKRMSKFKSQRLGQNPR